MTQPQAAEIAAQLAAARTDTLALFDLAPEAVLHASPGFGFRPIIWHLAHIGVFEAYWLLQKLAGEPAPDARYERIFDPISTPREESKNLPTRREMEDYLARVRARVLAQLARVRFDADEPLLRDAYIYNLVLEHERQHQETLAYLLHLLDPAQKLRPQVMNDHAPSTSAPPAPRDMIDVPAGACVIGAPWPVFVYDNERPAHTVNVPAFKIDRLLTTNEEFAHFIKEGGYERREWWSEEGWTWRTKEGWTCPLYWTRAEAKDNGDGWLTRTMFEAGALAPLHPVVGVSWYEAEAYACFAGKRLPTEAEWEKAATWDAAAQRKRMFAWGDAAPDAARGNFELRHWGTTPVGSFPQGASPVGCLDMNGNVWEWTSDPFAGFPDFKAYPYPEYSEVWFDGDHRVLKGGSWATCASILRTSFRNFFRRHFRIAFAGIRCAADA
ncbi:MAG TPA: SUMF1/EgtB/PvdO family nonheme iron enzyme [Pyrinomonadaceae bacterium]|jgi:iron(II)-dependent oxidoreductase